MWQQMAYLGRPLRRQASEAIFLISTRFMPIELSRLDSRVTKAPRIR